MPYNYYRTYNDGIHFDPVIRDKIIEKIESFATLPVGWDYGEGVPASKLVIRKAFIISNYRFFFPSFRTNARPTTEGGIIVTLFLRDHFLDITINPNLKMDLRYEIGIGENYYVEHEEGNVSEDKIFEYLSIIREKCILSELYTSGSMLKTSGDLEVIVSGATTEFPYLMKNVQGVPVTGQSVLI